MTITSHKIAAFLTATALIIEANISFAQTTGIGRVTDNIVQSAVNTPDLVSAAAYIGGIGMGVTGVVKLKQHVDQPTQNPMKDGLVRLGAGGGLLALPAITTAMIDTVGEQDVPAPGVVQFDAINL